MQNKNLHLNKILYGGDYNPEQWLAQPGILEKDIKYMKEAHINAVSMGIFSWSALEPEEEKYDFSWMEERIDTLYRNGIVVFLSTPSGGKPKWMADKYPEVLRVDENHNRNLYGFRHNHCYTSPIYREKVRVINMELARHFGRHPGVLAWHISNEYGGECCPFCQRQFQVWLRERYGTIEELNRAWNTSFWSHTYQSFEQVEGPSPKGEQFLHGLNLDWHRFVTDRTVDFARHEIQAIRDAGSDKPVTINMMYNFKDLNYHKFADVVDFISWDTYPTWHKEAEMLTAMDCGMQHDIMRSIQKKPFVLMESCPSATNWQSVSKLKKPGMLAAASLQAIAHGSDSVLYFQIRQSRGSYEKFHGAVIDHYGGNDTRVFEEVKKVGLDLELLKNLAGANVVARAAVVYDWENRWAMEDAAGPRNKNLYYKETVEKSYYAFRKYGMNVDVIDMEQSLAEYQVLAIPMLYLFRAGFEDKVRSFTERGGIVFMTYWSGIVDENDLCFLEGTPHGLMDVFGLRSEEIDSLYDGECNHGIPVEGNKLGLERTYQCEHLCDLVRVNTAEPLILYADDFYAGKPVLTEHSFGKGKAYYICADMEQAFYDDVYRRVMEQNEIKSIVGTWRVPDGVEVTCRETDMETFIFVQNYNRFDITIPLQPDLEILVGGSEEVSSDIILSSFGTIVLCRRKQ